MRNTNSLFITIDLLYNPENTQKNQKTTKNQKQTNTLSVSALIDSGATANFMDAQFCHEYSIPTIQTPQTIEVTLVDGHSPSAGNVSIQTIPIELIIGDRNLGLVTFLVSNISRNNPVILGHEWITLSGAGVYGDHILFPDGPIYGSNYFLPVKVRNSCPDPENYELFRKIESKEVLPDPFIKKEELEKVEDEEDPQPSATYKTTQLPEIYSSYQDIFSPAEADVLPEHSEHDCKLELKDPALPLPPKKIYKLSPKETTVLKQYIDEMLEKNFIEESDAPLGAPIFFVPKGDGGLRPCVDYSSLNKNIKLNCYPLPLIDDLIDAASGANYYTKIDLISAFNRVRMAENDEWLTTFNCMFGSFRYKVMPFGLSVAPAVFSLFTAHVLRPYLYEFCVNYLDDILVYTKGSLELHQKHVKQVLERLRKFKLYAKLSKCRFSLKKIDFVGYVLTTEGITTDANKIAPIQDWKPPQSVKALQRFLGLTNYYRRFVESYSHISKPLTDLTKKDTPYKWTTNHQKAFDRLRKAITTAPILRHPDPKKQYLMDTDASDVAVGAVLMQKNTDTEESPPYPVAYFSRKLSPSQRNYSVYDKELYAILAALQFWRHYLYGTEQPILIYSDHQNLMYFKSCRVLAPRHARWSIILNEFNFKLTYKRGLENPVADALSRSDYEREKSSTKTNQTLLPPDRWQTLNTLVVSDHFPEFDDAVDSPLHVAYYLHNNEWHPNLNAEEIEEFSRDLANYDLMGPNKRLVRKLDGNTWATYLLSEERESRIMQYHNSLGHLGAQGILGMFKRRYWFPGNILATIKETLRNCVPCANNRGRRPTSIPIRPIHPEPLPFARWSLDFMGPFPGSNTRGKRFILVALDYATRYIVTKATETTAGEEVVEFLHERITNIFGRPVEILTDRAPQFLRGPVKDYMDRLGILPLRTSAYHPQTNGANERTHAMISHAIRTRTEDERTDWDLYLPQITYAINSRVHAGTQFSPYYLTYGTHPRLPVTNEITSYSEHLLDEQELERRNQERQTRTLLELGQARLASYHKLIEQMERMKKQDQRNRNLDDEEYEDLIESTHAFEVGDTVKIKLQTKHNMEDRYRGPYYVDKLGSPGLYLLTTARGHQHPTLINQDRLAKWTPGVDDRQTLPEDEDDDQPEQL